eukprot:1854734-Pyramimonas_sp.AAC.1
MPNSFPNLHHRREDAVIIVGVLSVGAASGRAVVVANITTSTGTITIVSTVCRRCNDTAPAQAANSK